MSLLDAPFENSLGSNSAQTVSLDDLDDFAARLAQKAADFSVWCFYGDLGAGKTTLIRAVSEAFGVDKRCVTSPTYVYLHHYTPAKKSKKESFQITEIAHFDLYRLKSCEDFFAMGWEEHLDGASRQKPEARSLTFIEWPGRLEEGLPKERLDIEIKIVDAEMRDITVYERS